MELNATIVARNEIEQNALLDSFRKFGIKPTLHNGKIEVHYHGSVDVISRLTTICEGNDESSIRIIGDTL